MRPRLEATDALIAAMERYEAAVGRVTHRAGNVVLRTHQSSVSSSERARVAPVTEATERAVAEIMSARGKPVPLAAIVAHLVAKGVPLPIHNQKNVVSARLSNSKNFVGRRGIGWWFADRPWPDDETDMLKEIEPSNGNTADGSTADEDSNSSSIENQD